MTTFAILKLDGELETKGFRVTLEIRRGNSQTNDILGDLPAKPELARQMEEHWEGNYRPLAAPYQHRGIQPLGIYQGGSVNRRQAVECQQSADSLATHFNQWLNEESLRAITEQLRSQLHQEQEICLLIRTQEQRLYKLPWQEWNLLADFPHTTVAFAPLKSSNFSIFSENFIRKKIRVLAILGHKEGIDIEADKQVLKGYSQADVTWLVEPQRQVISEHLWQDNWDIIFFAGHSETAGEGGRIYLNHQESLTVSELNYGLKKAAAKGLKLAIFNSCDGLGLAQTLHDCQIPYIIVMRELVPDRVAQCFFKYFLANFTKSNSFYCAVREAQQRLQGLEGEFPCATWLPVIYQQPTALSLSWKPSLIRHLTKVAGFGAIAAIAIMGMRGLGWLEFLELKTFDWLMQQRQPELIDNRIVVVEVTQDDLSKKGYLAFADKTIAQAINKLEQYKPRVIGLDIHRHTPRGNGRKDLIEQFHDNKNLLVVCAFNASLPDYAPPSELTAKQRKEQLVFSNLLIDDFDEKVRRQLLSYNPKLSTSISECSTPYSLSFKLAYRFLEKEGKTLEVNQKSQDWQLEKVAFKKLTNRYGGYQYLDGKSSQIMINYRSRNLPGKKISIKQILNESLDTNLIRDNIILIGYTVDVARDQFETPIGILPGVWIHAHQTSQIISAILDKRPLIWVLPEWNSWQWGDTLYVLIWSIIGGFLIGWWSLQSQWQGGVKVIGIGLIFGLSFILLYKICLFGLEQGLWLPFIPSAGCLLLTLIIFASYNFYKVYKHQKN